MRYTNFDLWIDTKVGDKYPLRAAAPLGESRGFLSLSPFLDEIAESQERLAKRDVDKAWLIAFGSQIYNSLFTGDIAALFEQCMGRIGGKEGQGVRVRLRIEAPEIAVLPWELLYWPRKECFLGTSMQCPLVRYLEIFEPIQALKIKPPLRMLVVIPQGPELNTENEKANLIHALAGLDDYVNPSFLEETVTHTRISDALLEEPFHVFHFIGHGDFRNDQAFLQINSENGGVDYIDDTQFASLFQNHLTMKLVFLNSCKGAETSSTKPLAGMAQQLVKQGIPAVVAMQYSIYDDAAVLFSREFYRSLFKGSARGMVDFAMCHARNRLASQFPGDRDIAAPVLFMRASEGLLFNLATGKPRQDFPISNKARDRSEAVARTYAQNIEIRQKRQEEIPDPRVETLIRSDTEELATLKRRLKFRRVSFATATGVALFMFFLSWIQIFDIFPPEIRIESYTAWLASVAAKNPLNEQIVIVPINDQTQKDIGREFGKDWRREHAVLVDKLSQAGAKVIAFDMFFEEQTPYDDEFAAAVRRAQDRHTAVIVGIRNLAEGQAKLTGKLKAANIKWGLLCIGKKWGTSQMAPLVVIKNDNSKPLHSLALEIKAAFQDREVLVDQRVEEIDFLNPATRQIEEKVGFSEIYEVKWEQAGCPVIGKHDTVASIIIAPYSLADSGNAPSQYSYEAIVKRLNADQLGYFKDKIILVGVERKDELFPTFRGFKREERYGLELHAAVVNSLLNRMIIGPLGEWGQFAIMVCLGTLGAVTRYWNPKTPLLSRTGIFVAVLLAYLGTSIYIYSEYHVLLNTIYHLLAFLVAYWAVGKVERRWFQ